jgi:hypothetical protein
MERGERGWHHMPDQLMYRFDISMRRPYIRPDVLAPDFVSVGPVLIGPQLVKAVELTQIAAEKPSERVEFPPAIHLARKLIHNAANRS